MKSNALEDTWQNYRDRLDWADKRLAAIENALVEIRGQIHALEAVNDESKQCRVKGPRIWGGVQCLCTHAEFHVGDHVSNQGEQGFSIVWPQGRNYP